MQHICTYVEYTVQPSFLDFFIAINDLSNSNYGLLMTNDTSEPSTNKFVSFYFPIKLGTNKSSSKKS